MINVYLTKYVERMVITHRRILTNSLVDFQYNMMRVQIQLSLKGIISDDISRSGLNAHQSLEGSR